MRSFWLRPIQGAFGLVAFAVIVAIVDLTMRALHRGVERLPEWVISMWIIIGVIVATLGAVLLSVYVLGFLADKAIDVWTPVWAKIRGTRSSRGPSSSSS